MKKHGKLEALLDLAEKVKKKSPKKMKEYMDNFRGTDALERPGSEVEDVNLVENIVKRTKPKKY